MADAISCQWTGEAFVPVERCRSIAEETFSPGAAYWLSAEAERSEKTHNHEFGWVGEAWKNLPEDIADLYPTSEHLRKRALIDGGFFTETIIDVGSNAAALRVRAFAQAEDQFAHVVVRGPIVVVRKAKSQSKRAMGAVDFQRSKTAILDIISALIGVAPGDVLQARAA